VPLCPALGCSGAGDGGHSDCKVSQRPDITGKEGGLGTLVPPVRPGLPGPEAIALATPAVCSLKVASRSVAKAGAIGGKPGDWRSGVAVRVAAAGGEGRGGVGRVGALRGELPRSGSG
jgi:hypothetical protein